MFSGEPPDAKGDLPGIVRYLRRLYRAKWFPGVDQSGLVYVMKKAGTVGRESVTKRRYLLEESQLRDHIREFFPHGAVHYACQPELRAVAHREEMPKALNFFVSQKTPQSIHEALLEAHPRLSIFQGKKFPPKQKDSYDEPLGIEYGRFREWQRIDAAIMAVKECNTSEMSR